MSQDQIQLAQKTQQLLHGPLKHVRAAALAAALLPLASVAVTTAEAQMCPSGGICGTVFYDENTNGIQDLGEPGIEGASVTLIWPNGQTTSQATTGCPDPPDPSYPCDPSTVGQYRFPSDFDSSGDPIYGAFQIVVQIPPGATPTNTEKDGEGNVVVSVVFTGSDIVADFGFSASEFANPGTGTPGYWKNHPDWPVPNITVGYKIVGGTKVGGVSYSIQNAIALLENVGKDKRMTMFSSLVPAMLNVLIGNDDTCVSSTIDAANAWMADYLPMDDVTKKVAASSYAWKVGEPLHRLMDNYNNGMLCAPHRD